MAVPGTEGSGKAGKALARGMEQRIHEDNVRKYGKDGVANRQNPVGANNKRRGEYLKAADKFRSSKQSSRRRR